MFSSPFPEAVQFVSAYAQSAEEISALEQEVHYQELALLSERAVATRRLQFLLGRKASRQALKNLGINHPSPVGKGERGQPLWPSNVIGSLTHTSTWAFAAVTWREDARAIGIDLEQLGTQKHGDISRYICHDTELCWVNEHPASRKDRLIYLFSAKESVFKALYPLCHLFFDFKDVLLEPKAEFSGSSEGGFCGELLRELNRELKPGFQFEVGYRVTKGYVLTHMLLQGA